MMSDYSDFGTLQQPSGGYAATATGTGYGSDQNPPSAYRDSTVRVAERDATAPKKKPPKQPRTKKTEWKAVKDGPHKSTLSIYILFYFSDISKSFTFDDFLARLHGSSDPARWPETSPFVQNSVEIVRNSNSDTAWTDLGTALHEPGAVVIYWGHSERAKNAKKARNLRPRPDSDDGSSDITVTQLNSLLTTTNAKSVIFAACATDGCVGKVKRDTAIIATDSGKDLLTNSIDWANALEKFLVKFIAGGTITECVAEGNKSFTVSSDPDDRFVLASGSGSLTLIN